MLQRVPHKDFRFLTSEELERFPSDPSELEEDCDTGYYIMANFSFEDPDVQSLMRDMPMFPFKTTVGFDQLSPFSQQLHLKLNKINGKPENWTSHPKLISDFSTRYGYWTHYLNAKLAVSLGVK